MVDWNSEVSDELLAAYIDGNTTSEENRLVELSVARDEQLAEVVDIACDVHDFEQSLADYLKVMEDYQRGTEDFSEIEDFFSISGVRLEEEEDSKRTEITLKDLDMTDMNEKMLGIDIAPNKFGEKELNVQFDQEVYQYSTDTCAIQSQALVLNQFGFDVTQEQLKEIALVEGWFIEGVGTPQDKVGKLLEYFGVEAHVSEGNNIFNLANELAQGHQVIVGVDAGELWTPGLEETLEDWLGGDQADHALIVAGIDTSDPDNVKVIVTDPGTGQRQLAYPANEFMEAWKDSKCFMVSTEQSPAEFINHVEDPDPLSFGDLSYNTLQALAEQHVNVESPDFHEFFQHVMEGMSLHELEDWFEDGDVLTDTEL